MMSHLVFHVILRKRKLRILLPDTMCSFPYYLIFFIPTLTFSVIVAFYIRMKYSISAVADKGLKKSLFTSARLKKGEVLYVETHSRR